MSDLISVIPALNIKLYIVAPKERQDKVMSELTRPTFQKIGLSEFCRFVQADELNELFSKVKDLEGYIQPNVVETISVELEEDNQSSLE